MHKEYTIVLVQVILVNAKKNVEYFESGFKNSLTNEKYIKTLLDKITKTTALILKSMLKKTLIRYYLIHFILLPELYKLN